MAGCGLGSADKMSKEMDKKQKNLLQRVYIQVEKSVQWTYTQSVSNSDKSYEKKTGKKTENPSVERHEKAYSFQGGCLRSLLRRWHLTKDPKEWGSKQSRYLGENIPEGCREKKRNTKVLKHKDTWYMPGVTRWLTSVARAEWEKGRQQEARFCEDF